MRLMIDANIILDHVLDREPFAQLSRKICLLGIAGFAETCLPVNVMTDLFYILRKQHGGKEAQRLIREGLSFIDWVAITPDDASYVLDSDWPDLEDCLLARCAEKIQADYIITRNKKDFAKSPVKAVTPEEFFKQQKQRGITYEEIDL